MFGIGKGKNGTGLLLPIIAGGLVGIIGYKMFLEPKEIDKKLQEQSKALMQNPDYVNEVLTFGINSNAFRYNTTPYIQPGSTTEWNPENLNLSGSISDAGNGYTFSVPKSAI